MEAVELLEEKLSQDIATGRKIDKNEKNYC